MPKTTERIVKYIDGATLTLVDNTLTIVVADIRKVLKPSKSGKSDLVVSTAGYRNDLIGDLQGNIIIGRAPKTARKTNDDTNGDDLPSGLTQAQIAKLAKLLDK